MIGLVPYPASGKAKRMPAFTPETNNKPYPLPYETRLADPRSLHQHPRFLSNPYLAV